MEDKKHKANKQYVTELVITVGNRGSFSAGPPKEPLVEDSSDLSQKRKGKLGHLFIHCSPSEC